MSNDGDRNRYVHFYKLSGAEDGSNEPVEDPWVYHKSKWANIKGERGMGTIRAAAAAGGVNTPLNKYSYNISYDRSITVGMQLRDPDGDRLNIIAVNHDKANRDWTDVVCEVGGANG